MAQMIDIFASRRKVEEDEDKGILEKVVPIPKNVFDSAPIDEEATQEDLSNTVAQMMPEEEPDLLTADNSLVPTPLDLRKENKREVPLQEGADYMSAKNVLRNTDPKELERFKATDPNQIEKTLFVLKKMRENNMLNPKDETVGKQLEDKLAGFVVGNLAMVQPLTEVVEHMGRIFGNETLEGISKDAGTVVEGVKEAFLLNMGELSTLDELSIGIGTSASLFVPGLGAVKAAKFLGAAPAVATIVGASVQTVLEAASEGGSVMEQWLEKHPGDYAGATKRGGLTFALNIPLDAVMTYSLLRYIKYDGKLLLKSISKKVAGKGVTGKMAHVLAAKVVGTRMAELSLGGGMTEVVQNLMGNYFAGVPFLESVKEIPKSFFMGALIPTVITSTVNVANAKTYMENHNKLLDTITKTAEATKKAQQGYDEVATGFMNEEKPDDIKITEITDAEKAVIQQEQGDALMLSGAEHMATNSKGEKFPLTEKMYKKIKGDQTKQAPVAKEKPAAKTDAVAKKAEREKLKEDKGKLALAQGKAKRITKEKNKLIRKKEIQEKADGKSTILASDILAKDKELQVVAKEIAQLENSIAAVEVSTKPEEKAASDEPTPIENKKLENTGRIHLLKGKAIALQEKYTELLEKQAREEEDILTKLTEVREKADSKENPPSKAQEEQYRQQLYNLNARLEGGLPGDASLAAVEKQLQIIGEEIGLLEEDNISLTGENVTLKAAQVAKLQRDRISELFRGWMKGLKVGSRQALRQAKEIRDYLIAQVNNSELTAKQKNSFIASINKIDTVAKLDKAMPRFEERLDEMAAANANRYLKNQIVKNVQKTLKKMKKHDLGKGYQAKIDDLLKNIDFKKLAEKRKGGTSRTSLMATRDFIANNPDNAVPDKVLAQLDRLDKKPIADMTFEELQTLDNALAHALKLNDLKNKLITKNKVRMFDKVLKRVEVVLERSVKEKDTREDVLDMTARGKAIGDLKAFLTVQHMDMATIAERLDKSKDDIFKQVFVKDISEGVRAEIKHTQDAISFFRKGIEGIDISRWSEAFYPASQFNLIKKGKEKFFKLIGKEKYTQAEMVDVTLENGDKIKMTRGQRLSLIMYSRRESAMTHIEGKGFSSERGVPLGYKNGKPVFDVVISKDHMKKIVADVVKNSPDDIKVADVMAAWMVKQGASVSEVYRRLNGLDLVMEENYWKIKADSTFQTKNMKSKQEERVVSMESMKSFNKFTIEDAGFTKETTNATNPIRLQDAFTLFNESMTEAATYIGLAEPLRNAKKLYNSTEVQRGVTSVFSPQMLKEIKNYVTDIEGFYINPPPASVVAMDLMNKRRAAILALNIAISPKQMISYAYALTEMESKYVMDGLRKGAASKDLISRYSPELWRRFEGHSTIEMDEIHRAGAVRHNLLGTKTLMQKLVSPIGYFDYQAIGRIWNAVESEISDTQPNLVGEEKMQAIARRTEEVVNNTQPPAHIKDRSAVGRSKSTWLKLSTSFTSQSNKVLNMTVRAINEYSFTKNKKALAKKLSVMYVMGSLMLKSIDILSAILRGRLTREDMEKAMTEDLGKTIAKGLITTATMPLKTFYFVGPLITAAERGIFDGQYYTGGNLVEDTLGMAVFAANNMVKGVGDMVENDEGIFNEYIQKAAYGILDMTATLAGGYPVKNVKDIAMSPFKAYDFLTEDGGDGNIPFDF